MLGTGTALIESSTPGIARGRGYAPASICEVNSLLRREVRSTDSVAIRCSASPLRSAEMKRCASEAEHTATRSTALIESRYEVLIAMLSGALHCSHREQVRSTDSVTIRCAALLS